jgi:carboxyl-terminal processing protease
MTNENNKKIFNFLGVILLAVSCFGFGLFFGRTFKNLGGQKTLGLSDYKLSDDPQRELDLFWEVWNSVEKYYVDPDKVDTQEMYYGAIKGMVNSTDDPATLFFTPEETEEFNNQSAGKLYEGIGAELGYKEGLIRVVAPIEGSPAEKAGLRPNDIIIKVDDYEIKSSDNIYDVVDMIRGEAGTEVVLTILRGDENEVKEVSINRGKIDLPSISVKKPSQFSSELKKYDNVVAVIDVSRFTDEDDFIWKRNWDNAVDQVVNGGYKKIIVDLRDNPGGYFSSATYAADEFIEGSNIIATQKNRAGEVEEFKAGRKGDLETDVQIVVLVNEGSASASEILAGALQHYNEAEVIGMPTFGKGTAQIIVPLEGNASLHLTTIKWLLPNGEWITTDNPVVPDTKVEFTEEDFENEKDPQMNKALEVLGVM